MPKCLTPDKFKNILSKYTIDKSILLGGHQTTKLDYEAVRPIMDKILQSENGVNIESIQEELLATATDDFQRNYILNFIMPKLIEVRQERNPLHVGAHAEHSSLDSTKARAFAAVDVIDAMRSDLDIQNNVSLTATQLDAVTDPVTGLPTISAAKVASVIGRKILTSSGKVLVGLEAVELQKLYIAVGTNALNQLQRDGFVTVSSGSFINNRFVDPKTGHLHKEGKKQSPVLTGEVVRIVPSIDPAKPVSGTGDYNSMAVSNMLKPDSFGAKDALLKHHVDHSPLLAYYDTGKLFSRGYLPAVVTMASESVPPRTPRRSNLSNGTVREDNFVPELIDDGAKVYEESGVHINHSLFGNTFNKMREYQELADSRQVELSVILREKFKGNAHVVDELFGLHESDNSNLDDSTRGVTQSEFGPVQSFLLQGLDKSSDKPWFNSYKFTSNERLHDVTSVLNGQTDKFFSRSVVHTGEYTISTNSPAYAHLQNAFADIVGEHPSDFIVEPDVVKQLDLFDKIMRAEKADPSSTHLLDFMASLSANTYNKDSVQDTHGDKYNFTMPQFKANSQWEYIRVLQGLSDYRKAQGGKELTSTFTTAPDGVTSGLTIMMLQAVGKFGNDNVADVLAALGMFGEEAKSSSKLNVDDFYSFLLNSLKNFGNSGESLSFNSDSVNDKQPVVDLVKANLFGDLRNFLAKPTTMTVAYSQGAGSAASTTAKTLADEVLKLDIRKVSAAKVQDFKLFPEAKLLYLAQLLLDSEEQYDTDSHRALDIEKSEALEISTTIAKHLQDVFDSQSPDTDGNASPTDKKSHAILQNTIIKALESTHFKAGTKLKQYFEANVTNKLYDSVQESVVEPYVAKYKAALHVKYKEIEATFTNPEQHVKILPPQIALHYAEVMANELQERQYIHENKLQYLIEKHGENSSQVKDFPPVVAPTAADILSKFGMSMSKLKEAISIGADGKEVIYNVKQRNEVSLSVIPQHAIDNYTLLKTASLVRKEMESRGLPASMYPLHDANVANPVVNAIFESIYPKVLLDTNKRYDVLEQLNDSLVIYSDLAGSALPLTANDGSTEFNTASKQSAIDGISSSGSGKAIFGFKDASPKSSEGDNVVAISPDARNMAPATTKELSEFNDIKSRVLKLFPDITIEYSSEYTSNLFLEGDLGDYNSKTNVITVPEVDNSLESYEVGSRTHTELSKYRGSSLETHIIAHEFVHAGVFNFMNNNPKHPLTVEMVELFNRLVPEDKRGANYEHYFQTNVHEFVAEFMTNTSISGATLPTPSLFGKLLNVVRKMLGLKQPTVKGVVTNTFNGMLDAIERDSSLATSNPKGAVLNIGTSKPVPPDNNYVKYLPRDSSDILAPLSKPLAGANKLLSDLTTYQFSYIQGANTRTMLRNVNTLLSYNSPFYSKVIDKFSTAYNKYPLVQSLIHTVGADKFKYNELKDRLHSVLYKAKKNKESAFTQIMSDLKPHLTHLSEAERTLVGDYASKYSMFATVDGKGKKARSEYVDALTTYFETGKVTPFLSAVSMATTPEVFKAVYDNKVTQLGNIDRALIKKIDVYNIAHTNLATKNYEDATVSVDLLTHANQTAEPKTYKVLSLVQFNNSPLDPEWKVLRKGSKSTDYIVYKDTIASSFTNGLLESFTPNGGIKVDPSGYNAGNLDPVANNYIDGYIKLTDEELSIVGKRDGINGFAQSISNTMFIDDTLAIRSTLTQEAITLDLTESISAPSQIETLRQDIVRGRENHQWMLKVSHAGFKALPKEIQERYGAVDKKVSIGTGLEDVTYVRNDIKHWLTGERKLDPTRNTSPLYQKTYKVWRNFVQMYKIRLVTQNPMKLAGDFLSNYTFLVERGVPLNLVAKYSHESFKVLSELQDLARQDVMNRLKGNSSSLVANHPMSFMYEDGFIQSMTNATVADSKETATGLQHDINSILDKINMTDGQVNIFGKLMEKASNLAIAPEYMLRALSLTSKVLTGDQLSKGLDKLAGQLEQVRTESDAKGFINEIIGSPDSVITKAGTATVIAFDAVPRSVYYMWLRDNHKEGGLTHEEAVSAVNKDYIDYRVPLPKELQILADTGIIMFPTFIFRIQQAIFRLAVKKPITVMASAMFEAYYDIDLMNIQENNLINRDLEDTILNRDIFGMVDTDMLYPNHFISDIDKGIDKLMSL